MDVGVLRNIAFVGHPSSGKTTLVDALAHEMGASDRKGSVADKTSICDTEPEEHERHHRHRAAEERRLQAAGLAAQKRLARAKGQQKVRMMRDQQKKRITAAGMQRYYSRLHARHINRALAELGLQHHSILGWELTALGRSLGGQQEESENSGAFYVTWPHEIIDNAVIHRELTRQSDQSQPVAPPADGEPDLFSAASAAVPCPAMTAASSYGWTGVAPSRSTTSASVRSRSLRVGRHSMIRAP